MTFHKKGSKNGDFTPECVESWSSEIEQEKFDFIWSLRNFPAFIDSSTGNILSPVFSGGSSNNEWRLELSPKHKIGNKEYVSVYLRFLKFGNDDPNVPNSERTIRASFRIGIIGSNGKLIEKDWIQQVPSVDFKETTQSGVDKFLKLQKFNNLKNNKYLCEGYTLKIKCEVTLDGAIVSSRIVDDISKYDGPKSELSLNRYRLLKTNLKQALDNAEYSDVTINIKNGNQIMAHKMILAARSTVFEKMFKSKPQETSALVSTKSAITIDDFEDDIVRGMLEWCYTGETNSLKANAAELLKIADKFQLIGLKEDCERILLATLTIESAADVLVLSHLHAPTTLKPKVVAFINRYKQQVRRTESFYKMTRRNSSVVADLYMSSE